MEHLGASMGQHDAICISISCYFEKHTFELSKSNICFCNTSKSKRPFQIISVFVPKKVCKLKRVLCSSETALELIAS